MHEFEVATAFNFVYLLTLYRVTPTPRKNRSKRKKTVMGWFFKGVARIAMEDEARWIIKSNLATEKKVPDSVNYIYVDDLKEVKLETVNIIR